MSQSGFYSPRVERYRKAVEELNAASREFQRPLKWSANGCLLRCALAETPGYTYKELAKKTGLSMSTVKTISKMMENNDVIRITREMNNRLYNKLYLTPKGEDEHKQILKEG